MSTENHHWNADIHNPFSSDSPRTHTKKYRSSPPVRREHNDAAARIATGQTTVSSQPSLSRLELLKQRQSTPTTTGQDPLRYSNPSSSSSFASSSVLSSTGRRFSLPEISGNWWTALGVCICHVVCWLFTCCGTSRKCTRKQKAWWLVIVTFVLTFLLTIFVSVEMYNAGAEPHILAWFSGGMCVILAVPISIFEIFWHLVYFSNPSLQRYVIRILWMVPIYGIESWFALRYTENAVYLQAFREFYEAYVIWSFLHFLMSFLGDHEADIVDLLQRKRTMLPSNQKNVRHLPPFCCLKSWKLGHEFFYKCKIGVLQYVVIKILTTTLTVISVNNQIYGEGTFSLINGTYMYIVFLDNCSQLWALYCLAMFYSGLKKELKPIKPFSKFLSVKAIVFFSWWQGFFIQLAVSFGYITHTAFYTKDNVARALQNWLVCIEMLIFAIAHKYAFSYKEYVDVRDRNARNFLTALFDSTVPVDFIMDMQSFAHTFDRLPTTDVVDGSSHSSDEEYPFDDSVFHTSPLKLEITKEGEEMLEKDTIIIGIEKEKEQLVRFQLERGLVVGSECSDSSSDEDEDEEEATCTPQVSSGRTVFEFRRNSYDLEVNTCSNDTVEEYAL